MAGRAAERQVRWAAFVPTTFTQLSKAWNAEPNAPNPEVSLGRGTLELRFLPNASQYPNFDPEHRLVLSFHSPWRWRLGSVNDEGWYRGQCRFSSLAPAWGEFYEVSGDLLLSECPDDWQFVTPKPPGPTTHYLFYFRDEEFECDAAGWSLSREHAAQQSAAADTS